MVYNEMSMSVFELALNGVILASSLKTVFSLPKYICIGTFCRIFCSIYFVPYAANRVSFKPVGTVQNIFFRFAIFTKMERVQAIPQSLVAARAARTRRVQALRQIRGSYTAIASTARVRAL